MKAFPKPSQNPYSPIIGGGGAGPKTLDFVVTHCDGWMPILGYPKWSEIKDGIVDLHRRAA
jgi:alkanesulfonate monooxygenase SsuD/methylene tetrahydromethanopterin reductase-like flavin-dependent oxidoreductase (luciferase family)